MTCFLWFHDWDKWGELIEQTMMATIDRFSGYVYDPPKEFIRLSQERSCKKCGTKERRVVQ